MKAHGNFHNRLRCRACRFALCVGFPTLRASRSVLCYNLYAVFPRISLAGEAAPFAGRLGWQENVALIHGLIKIARRVFTEARDAAGILSPGRHPITASNRRG
jgi:hypothetical protein